MNVSNRKVLHIYYQKWHECFKQKQMPSSLKIELKKTKYLHLKKKENTRNFCGRPFLEIILTKL
jgi:hypothetical protein